MKLNGLFDLYKDMKKNNIERYRFDYKNGKGDFDIFFFKDENPFILLFGAKGGNFSFEMEVKSGFIIETKIDKKAYRKLINFLGIEYLERDPFSTFKFFENFNLNIPNKLNISNIAKPHEVIRYRKSVDEPDKIYFWKWLDDTKQGNKVSNENLEKTKRILGEEAYLRCKEKEISSCWTDDKSKKRELISP
jgi:hypothetical protein